MEGRLKVYYDAEFTGLHKNTNLISIGLVSESGSTFYAEFTDYDKSQVDNWLQKYVIDNLLFNNVREVPYVSEFVNSVYEYVEDGHRRYIKQMNLIVKGDCHKISELLDFWLRNELEFTKHTENPCDQIQIYCDCYAYDWMLFNDLICENGLAMNFPKYLYYIPVDLSTYLQMRNIDPDITREVLIHKLLPDYDLEDDIMSKEPFRSYIKFRNNLKHNSLWDALICKLCFETLENLDDGKLNLYLTTKNRRIYSARLLNESLKDFCRNKNIPYGEKDHPIDNADMPLLEPAKDPNIFECSILEIVKLNKSEYLVERLILDKEGGKTYLGNPINKLSAILFIHIPTQDIIRVTVPELEVDKICNAHDKDFLEKINNI